MEEKGRFLPCYSLFSFKKTSKSPHPYVELISSCTMWYLGTTPVPNKKFSRGETTLGRSQNRPTSFTQATPPFFHCTVTKYKCTNSSSAADRLLVYVDKEIYLYEQLTISSAHQDRHLWLHHVTSQMEKRQISFLPKHQRWASTTFVLLQSAIAIPQLEGSTSAIAIPQLFKKCCSATATLQFRNRNFFLSPQLQVRNLRASLPQFLAYFWPWSSLKLYIFYHQVFFCY